MSTDFETYFEQNAVDGVLPEDGQTLGWQHGRNRYGGSRQNARAPKKRICPSANSERRRNVSRHNFGGQEGEHALNHEHQAKSNKKSRIHKIYYSYF